MRIKEIIKEKGLTLQEVAQIMGISQPALSRVVNGNPTVDMLERIAAALDVSVVDLFEKNEDVRIFVEYRGERHEITKRDIIRLIDEPRIPDHENIRGKEYYK